MEIKNKVVVVTGASGGIGLAIARELGRRGATLVLAARSADKLKEIAAEIPGSLAVPTDMTKQGDIKALIAQAKETFGRVDVLVNNAGVGLRSPVAEVNIEEYRAIMELNVFGVLRAMQEVVPLMRAQGGGLILNISSMVSKNYYPGMGAYASTKYALNALSLTARTELAGDHIVVSVFHPRMTATEFGANAFGRKYSSPAGRPGLQVDTAPQVAAAVADQIESEVPEAGMGM